MDCKQVNAILNHLDELSPEIETSLKEHLTNCSRCQKNYEDAKKLEGLLTEYYSYPPLMLDMSFLKTVSSPLKQRLQKNSFLIVAVFMLLLCTFLFFPSEPQTPPIKIEAIYQQLSSPKTFIHTSTQLIPGSSSSMLIAINKGFSSSPQVSATLIDQKTGKPVYTLFEKVDIPENSLQQEFKIPNIPVGAYDLQITTVSAKGDILKEYKTEVQVKKPLKLLLQTDKPRYQNSQIIHLHTLLFSKQQNETPQFKEFRPISFTIKDPKGNLIFKEEKEHNEFGAAWCSFPLADEVSFGEYQIQAECDGVTAEKTVLVDRYQLPKMKLKVKTNQEYYTFNQPINVELNAKYPYGKPIFGAKVSFQFYDENSNAYPFSNIDNLTTNEEGKLEQTFSLTIPRYIQRNKKDLKLFLVTTVIDEAQQVEYHTKTLFLSQTHYKLSLVPEGGILRTNLPNTIFCVATTPNGKPLKMDLTLEAGGQTQHISTQENGIAKFSLTPHPARVIREKNKSWYPINYTIKPNTKNTAKTIKLPVDTSFEQLLVTLDQAIYEPGDSFVAKALGNTNATSIFFSITQDGSNLLQQKIQIPSHQNTPIKWSATLPPSAAGHCLLTATQVLPSGQWLEDQRTFFVRPSGIKINITSNQKIYAPGEEIKLTFKAFSENEKNSTPVPSAALAVSIVDESVFSLPSKNLAQLFYSLENRLRQNKASLLSPTVIEESLELNKIEAAKQNAAKALYATIKDKKTFITFGDPEKTPEEIALAKKILAKNFKDYLLDHSFLMKEPTTKNIQKIDPHLITRMIFDLKLKIDPLLLGEPFKLTEILTLTEVGPELHNIHINQIPKRIERLRRISLKKLCQPNASHSEIIRTLQRKKISKERAFTPNGTPIHFQEVKRKYKSSKQFSQSLEEETSQTETGYFVQPENLRRMQKEKLKKTGRISGGEKEETSKQPGKGGFGNSDSGKGNNTSEKKVIPIKTKIIKKGKGKPPKLKKNNEQDPNLPPTNTNQTNRDEVDKEKGRDSLANLLFKKAKNFTLFDTPKPDSTASKADKEIGDKKGGMRQPADTWQKKSEKENQKENRRNREDQKESSIWDFFSGGAINEKKDEKPEQGLISPQTQAKSPFLKKRKRGLNDETDPDEERGKNDIRQTFVTDPPEIPAKETSKLDKELKEIDEDFDEEPAGGIIEEEEEKVDDNQKIIAQLIRFRKYFPETLLFNPNLLISNGEGSLTISNAPDSITTFRVSTTLSTTSGDLGQKQSNFVVFKPFFVDLNLPTHLTVGDELRLPIVLHNYLAEPQEIEIILEKQEWFEFLKEETNLPIMVSEKHIRIVRKILPGKVISIEFPIQITQAGNQTIRVLANAKNSKKQVKQDGIAKDILVVPFGQKKTLFQNHLLTTNPETISWISPKSSIKGQEKVFLRIYPDLLSHLRNSSTELEKVQFGGIEDVLNRGFPIVFLYKALKEENRLTPKAQLEINYLFQRILSYQNKKGFSHFRKGEPELLLTVLSLYILHEIQSFQSWESPLLQQCKEFILAQRNRRNGSFYPFQSSYSFTKDRIALTSFIYWILKETGVPASKLTKTKRFLKDNIAIEEKTLCYSLSLLARAKSMTPFDLSQEFGILKSPQITDNLIVSALRLIALNADYDTAKDDLKYLLSNKQSEGAWDSLLLNIFATQALLVYHQKHPPTKELVQLDLNGTIQQLQPELSYSFPLSQNGQPQEWKLQASREIFCQIVTQYYIPWELEEKETTKKQLLKVDYQTLSQPKSFPNWEAKVHFNKGNTSFKAPVLLEIGIPPGFQPANLSELESEPFISHFEQTQRHILVYLDESQMNQEIEFAIRLRPQLRLKVKTPHSGYRELTYQGKSAENSPKKDIDTINLH